MVKCKDVGPADQPSRVSEHCYSNCSCVSLWGQEGSALRHYSSNVVMGNILWLMIGL